MLFWNVFKGILIFKNATETQTDYWRSVEFRFNSFETYLKLWRYVVVIFRFYGSRIKPNILFCWLLTRSNFYFFEQKFLFQIDLTSQRVVTEEEGRQLAAKLKLPYIETSAKVLFLFIPIIRQVWKFTKLAFSSSNAIFIIFYQIDSAKNMYASFQIRKTCWINRHFIFSFQNFTIQDPPVNVDETFHELVRIMKSFPHQEEEEEVFWIYYFFFSNFWKITI